MTDVKHLHEALIFADPVVNQNWTVLQFAYAGPFSNAAAHSWKTGEQIHVVEQSVAKTRSGLAVIFGNVTDDLGEIA